MKITEAQKIYRANRQELIDQRRLLIKQRDALEKKKLNTPNGSELFAEEAATLELSIKDVNSKFDENQEILDKLTEQYCAVWNAEVSKQQADALSEAYIDLSKIMEVARRIADGAKVPSTDEQKLMEYSMELYMAAKNMAVMNADNDDEYDSLWDDEEDEQEYDPKGKADSAETNMPLPEISVPDFSAGAPSSEISAPEASAE
ncbi:MAG: hypothetical protein NC223_04450 [Butyrivibrio sp.]|nr:hypothetical protein [Butyrivibrio sp.]